MNRKCLILKDMQGSLCGYLLQEDGKIDLKRRAEAVQGGTLVCIDVQGRTCRLSLEEGTEEMQWADEGEELKLVYGVTGGGLMFVSGEDARRAYDANRETENRGIQSVRIVVQEVRKRQNEPPPGEWAAVQNRMMEIRWPPPPCLQGARYSGGRWQMVVNAEC